MKKRLASLSMPLVILGVLALPGSAAAASHWTYKIVDQHCISGGHNIYFRVKLTAAGSTPTNKLTIKSTSQYQSQGTWHDSYHWKTNKSKFTVNGAAHSIDYSYQHVDNSDSRHWRIVSVLTAFEGQHYLDGKTLTSKAC